MAELRFAKAINQALADAMRDDPAVVLFGEDVAAAGGPFGVTRGLLDAFGPQRVLDAPISEAAIVGAAVGAALCGLKPVVEIQFFDTADRPEAHVTLPLALFADQSSPLEYSVSLGRWLK